MAQMNMVSTGAALALLGGNFMGGVPGAEMAAGEGVPCLRNFWFATAPPRWRG